MIYKYIKIIFLFGIILGSMYISRFSIQNIWREILTTYYPCKSEITYSIGTFDTQFGISKEDFIKDMATAESIWEGPAGRQLFKYKETGGALKVNLIYDYRQDMTEDLKKLGLNIDDTQTSYNAIRSKYDSLKASYVQNKKKFDQIFVEYQKDKAQLEKEVLDLNAQGGAKGEEYNRIVAKGEALNLRSVDIKNSQDALNKQVDTLNVLVNALNRTAKTLNVSVSKFNQIGKDNGQEFDEALYIEEASGNHIDVFQFNDNNKLVRVLAHELGHALGLVHNENPKAIMFRLNKSTNLSLAADDLNALKTKCEME